MGVDGSVTADGQIVTLDHPRPKLADLKADDEVWYRHDNSSGDPHPNAMHVIDLLGNRGLTIKFFTRPDFTDTVDLPGASHPNRR